MHWEAFEAGDEVTFANPEKRVKLAGAKRAGLGCIEYEGEHGPPIVTSNLFSSLFPPSFSPCFTLHTSLFCPRSHLIVDFYRLRIYILRLSHLRFTNCHFLRSYFTDQITIPPLLSTLVDSRVQISISSEIKWPLYFGQLQTYEDDNGCERGAFSLLPVFNLLR